MADSRVTPAEFVRQVRREASKVTWPTRRETMVSVAMVLVMVTIAALFFLAVDSVVSYVVRVILGLGA